VIDHVQQRQPITIQVEYVGSYLSKRNNATSVEDFKLQSSRTETDGHTRPMNIPDDSETANSGCRLVNQMEIGSSGTQS
jgi:hypothetical protein